MPGRPTARFRPSAAAPVPVRRRRFSARLLLAGALAALTMTPAFAAPELAAPELAAPEPCPEIYDRAGRIAAIGPAGDLLLEDGAALRLAGISVSPEVLRDMVGRAVERAALPPPASGRDRYGRQPALVRLGGSAESVQADLLARGLALVRPENGVLGCLPALLAAEAAARRGGHGVWATLPLDATDVAAISEHRGRFTIVAGRVLGVGNTRALSYLNFGPVWRQDMTGRLTGPARIALEARGDALAGLVGRRVTLRGTVLEAGGPAIELTRIEQIEWDEDVAAERMGGR